MATLAEPVVPVLDSDDDEEPAEDFWRILPKPGLVFRYRTMKAEGALNNARCYINICHDEHIRGPIRMMTPEQFSQKVYIRDESYHLPLHLGEVEKLGKEGKMVKLDVVINSAFFEKCMAPETGPQNRMFVLAVVVPLLKSQHGIEVQLTDFGILKRKYVGTRSEVKVMKETEMERSQRELREDIAQLELEDSQKQNLKRMGMPIPNSMKTRYTMINNKMLRVQFDYEIEGVRNVDPKKYFKFEADTKKVEIKTIEGAVIIGFAAPETPKNAKFDPKSIRLNYNVENQCIVVDVNINCD